MSIFINFLFKKMGKDFLIKNFLVLFFAYDFLIKIIVHYTQISLFYNYVIVFKVIIVMALILNTGFKKINTSYFLPLIALILAYVITQFNNYNSISIDDIQFNGYYFLSSTTPILFLIFCGNHSLDIVNSQINRFVWFIVFSSFFLFIGYLFEIEVFRSYFRGGRFGFSGFLLYHHEAGFIYFIIIFTVFLIIYIIVCL